MISPTKKDTIQTTKLFCEFFRIENTDNLLNSIFAHRSSRIFHVKLTSDIFSWYFSFAFGCLQTGEIEKGSSYYTFKFKQIYPEIEYIVLINSDRILVCTDVEAKDLFTYTAESPAIDEEKAEAFLKRFFK